MAVRHLLSNFFRCRFNANGQLEDWPRDGELHIEKVHYMPQ